MSCYIDANELLTRLPEDLPYKASVKRVLMQVPTADVAEVKHGHWVYDAGILICLNCEAEIEIKNSFGIENHRNYCPCCGAKMDGERRAEE